MTPEMISQIMAADVMLDTLPEPEPLPDTPGSRRFCPLSLSDWLSLCAELGVPHVPGEVVAAFSRYDALRYGRGITGAADPIDAVIAATDRVDAVIAAANRSAAASPGYMLRADYAAPAYIKVCLSAGEYRWTPAMADFAIEDDRIIDLLYDWPRERVPLLRRPWLTDVLIHEGWPVEYRAFVSDGALLGISSYYPQRPLPLWEQHLACVRSFTDRLCAALRKRTPFCWPLYVEKGDNDGPLDKNGVHFTADYIVRSDDSVLFLEGGPPHEMGAHPCCFPEGRISGVALEDARAPADANRLS